MWIFNPKKKMPKPERAKPLRRKKIADREDEDEPETPSSDLEVEELRRHMEEYKT